MSNVLLVCNSDGWVLNLQLGTHGGALGFLWFPLPLLILGCFVFWCVSAISAGKARRNYDRREGVRSGGHRFWAYALIIGLVVLATRGFRDHGRWSITVDPDNHPATRVDNVERAAARLENRLDRAGDEIDHNAAQAEQQVDRRTAQIARQLEHLAAQLERHFRHVGQHVILSHRDLSVPVAVAQAPEEPAVTEPRPPAMPVAGPAPAEATVVVTSPPAAAPSSTPPVATVAVAPAQPPIAAVATSTEHAAPSAADPTATVDSEKLPDWTKTEIVDEGTRKLVVVPGGFGTSPKDAEREALEAARIVVGEAIQRAYPKVGDWRPSADAIREDAVRLTFVEKVHRKTVSSGTPFIVYRAYQQVELSPAVFSQLISSWKEEVLPHRLEALGGFAALLTLTFATGAAYFRLDERTHGRYRGRLKLAAVTIVSAGVAAAGALAGELI
jgi:hypothetical protein